MGKSLSITYSPRFILSCIDQKNNAPTQYLPRYHGLTVQINLDLDSYNGHRRSPTLVVDSYVPSLMIHLTLKRPPRAGGGTACCGALVPGLPFWDGNLTIASAQWLLRLRTAQIISSFLKQNICYSLMKSWAKFAPLLINNYNCRYEPKCPIKVNYSPFHDTMR